MVHGIFLRDHFFSDNNIHIYTYSHVYEQINRRDGNAKGPFDRLVSRLPTTFYSITTKTQNCSKRFILKKKMFQNFDHIIFISILLLPFQNKKFQKFQKQKKRFYFNTCYLIKKNCHWFRCYIIIVKKKILF